MLSAAASDQAPRVEQPKYPLSAMTTYELRDYRRQLENAITFSNSQVPVSAVRGDLQAAFDAVIAEQESRERLTRG